MLHISAEVFEFPAGLIPPSNWTTLANADNADKFIVIRWFDANASSFANVTI